MDSEVKICSTCKLSKGFDSFNKNKRGTHGLQARCLECRKQEKFTRDYNKEYRQAIDSGKREAEREVRRQYAAKIRTEYPWKKRHYEAIRRARKLKATPAWADLEAIKLFYKNCPEGHEVDHIHPLLGKEVCGLHILSNLQYLSTTENRRKSNKCLDYNI